MNEGQLWDISSPRRSMMSFSMPHFQQRARTPKKSFNVVIGRRMAVRWLTSGRICGGHEIHRGLVAWRRARACRTLEQCGGSRSYCRRGGPHGRRSRPGSCVVWRIARWYHSHCVRRAAGGSIRSRHGRPARDHLGSLARPKPVSQLLRLSGPKGHHATERPFPLLAHVGVFPCDCDNRALFSRDKNSQDPIVYEVGAGSPCTTRRRIAAINAARSTGLVHTSSQPAARHFSCSLLSAWAVRATIGWR